MSCPASHPVRGAGGLDLIGELEIIGSHGSEVWARCRTCGAWFWTSTDLGGKHEYVGDVKLPTRLAERAFISGDLDALVELLVTNRVPHGPVWTTASALVEIFVALTPGASNAARAQALSARPGGALWARAAELFANQVSGEAKAPAPELVFSFDLTLPGDRWLVAHEVGASLILISEGAPELLRLDAARLVHVPLAGSPSVSARRRDAVVLAIATAAGDATVVLDAAGNATSFPPSVTSYAVTALDDGWWQFVPRGDTTARFVELHLPDGTPKVKFPRQFAPGVSSMPPARRFAGGWILSNLLDDDGTVQALTVFDDQFATVAFSEGHTGERQVTPIDTRSFWASSDGVVERWILRGRSLERATEHAIRSCWLVGDRLICDLANGGVVARGPDGTQLWTWHRTTTGASYGVATTGGVLLYDDDRAHLLDRDGTLVRSFGVESPDVRVGADSTVYLKSTDQLWIVREHAWAIDVALDATLETTCGDRVLLRRTGDRFELVDHLGWRAGFSAPGARFQVTGTAGGPYVVERTRLRVAAFAP